MSVQLTHSLKSYNTFGIDHACAAIIYADTRAQLIDSCLALYRQEKPFLILGGGSNILLTQNYLGTVVKVQTRGICVSEDDKNHYLAVEAGENWYELVKYCLNEGIFGLENLALIPGTVGAAPIQNIGAYGVEFVQLCDWVEYLDLRTGVLNRLTVAQCQFAYRDSIFKCGLKNVAVITRVGLKLPKDWQPNLSYGPLQNFSSIHVTAKQIFDRICMIRQQKLPDPAITGNAGSFFKNPIVSLELFSRLQQQHADIIGYPVAEGQMKLAAAWLIDNAELKGVCVGKAAVHQQQALVLINIGGASGDDLVSLAKKIIATVMAKYGVYLEPEPRVIGAIGEIELSQHLDLTVEIKSDTDK